MKNHSHCSFAGHVVGNVFDMNVDFLDRHSNHVLNGSCNFALECLSQGQHLRVWLGNDVKINRYCIVFDLNFDAFTGFTAEQSAHAVGKIRR